MEKLDVRVVLSILLINLIISLVVFVLGLFKEKDKKKTFHMISWFIFIVPLFGLFYIVLTYILHSYKRKTKVDISDISFSIEREEIILPSDRDVEINYVSIEDAIAISDKKSLRRLVFNTMLKGGKDTLPSLFSAINSNDSETSHYVASLMMEYLSNAKNKIHDLVDRLNNNKEDIELSLEAFEYIYETLDMNIMSDMERQTYIYILDDVANMLFENNLWYLSASHYLKLVDLFVSINEPDMVNKWQVRANEFRKDDLETYKINLHIYFWQNNNTAFLETLSNLRNSNLIVDEEILNLFRVFQ